MWSGEVYDPILQTGKLRLELSQVRGAEPEHAGPWGASLADHSETEGKGAGVGSGKAARGGMKGLWMRAGGAGAPPPSPISELGEKAPLTRGLEAGRGREEVHLTAHADFHLLFAQPQTLT